MSPGAPRQPARSVVAIALGSNLGDRLTHIGNAVDALSTVIQIDRVSSVYESEALGSTEQPRFLNAVVAGSTELVPAALLEVARRLERQAGRVPSLPNSPRSLDVDLILYGDLVIDEDDLAIPHPRFRERAFVLAPLDEVAGDWTDPVTGRTVHEIWDERAPDLPSVTRHAPPSTLREYL